MTAVVQTNLYYQPKNPGTCRDSNQQKEEKKVVEMRLFRK